MAYIDREKFVERIKHSPAFKNLGFEGEFLQGVVLDLLNNAPTADVVEVKRGHWIENPENKYGGDYMCSICGNDADESTFGSYEILTNYCSNCGAKMDAKKKVIKWQTLFMVLL